MATHETFETKKREIINQVADYLATQAGANSDFSGVKYLYRDEARQLIDQLYAENGDRLSLILWIAPLAAEYAANEAGRDKFLADPIAYNEAHP